MSRTILVAVFAIPVAATPGCRESGAHYRTPAAVASRPAEAERPADSADGDTKPTHPFPYESEVGYQNGVPVAYQGAAGFCDRFSGLGPETGSIDIDRARSRALRACVDVMIGDYQRGYLQGRAPDVDRQVEAGEMVRINAGARAYIASHAGRGMTHPDRWIEIELLMFDSGFRLGVITSCEVAWGADGAADAEHFKKCVAGVSDAPR